jgi:hypothetical protein
MSCIVSIDDYELKSYVFRVHVEPSVGIPAIAFSADTIVLLYHALSEGSRQGHYWFTKKTGDPAVACNVPVCDFQFMTAEEYANAEIGVGGTGTGEGTGTGDGAGIGAGVGEGQTSA